MIWILLAALGVPIWLVVGALGGVLWSRRKFRRTPGVFPCKVRIVSGAADVPSKWPRSTSYARWVHDVLLVHAGVALVRYHALPGAGIDRPDAPAPDVKVKGASDVVSIRVRIDDGSIAEVAGPASMKDLLSGPFLAHEPTEPTIH